MYCKKCGKLIADDSVYCNYCGAKQAPNNVTKMPTLSEDGVRKGILFFINIIKRIHLGRIIVLLFGANNRIIRLLRWGGLLRIVLIPRLLFLDMPFHRVHEAEE